MWTCKKFNRRKYQLNLPAHYEDAFVDISEEEAKFFTDASKEIELVVKDGVEVELKVPKDITQLEVQRARTFPALVELSINRTIWPKEGAIGLKFILDNREIDMVTLDGRFREGKYRLLCSDLAWKRWVILQYTYEDGSDEAILWWWKK